MNEEDEVKDTGDLAWVPEEERRGEDDPSPDSGDNALDGGADDDLDDVYANPGEVVEGDLV